MSTLKVSTIEPLDSDTTKTITIGSAGDTAAGVFTNTPAFSATTSAAQVISNQSWTLITFDVENYDPDSVYTNTASNYKFTVPTGKAGLYNIKVRIMIDAVAESQLANYQLAIYKNGSAVAVQADNNYNNNPISTIAQVDTLLNLSVGDYIQAYAYVSDGSGSPQLGSGDSTYSEFSGFKLIGG